jgi:hypothetical protein
MRHVHRQSKFERTRKCACCGGVNTRLRRDRAQWVCKNRDLCRKSMVYMNMLESL